MVNYSVQVGEYEDESPDLLVSGGRIGANPFPGLRPFTLDESHLFFGREGQVDEILLKLSAHRSVTIMGYSGSGKSSLMNCGLIPVLYGGFMTHTGPNWQVLSIRPGNSPIINLANSAVDYLIKQERIEEKDRPIYKSIFNSVLRSGSDGLVEVSKFLQTDDDENIFFLIDQFEELFRYKDSGNEEFVNEAALYVNLILTAIDQQNTPIYLAINMRSDFIGDCSSFPGLTQMINASNYLVPQMTREQKRMAIEGPVAVGGGKISPRLIKRLQNDIGDNQDQLPILQHALMRTWDYWIVNHEAGESMDIRHYNAVGRISQALSIHANEAYDEFSQRQKDIAEVLFKSISEKNLENQGMRRPCKIGLVAELAEASETEVIEVVEQFRKPGRSFLMPGIQVKLNANSTVELSHESLMRIWTRLTGWVDEEFESAQMYKRISEAAAMYQIGKTGLWRPPDLQLALNWQKKQKPTRTWAQRYDVAFERAVVFLDTSRITFEAELKNQEMLQRRMLRRARVTNIILAILLIIAIGFFFFGFTQKLEADKNFLAAKNEATRADAARDEALKQEQIAKDQTKLAEQRALEITKQNSQLEKQKDALEVALNDAKYQKFLAEKNLLLANEQRDSARYQREVALSEYNRAEKNFEDARRQLMLSIAQSLEAKSVRIDDKELAGLTAMQGYSFHTQYEGKKYDPYVFSGLYYALTKLSSSTYNAVKVPGSLKNKMFALAVSRKTNTFYTTGDDGFIYAGDFSDKGAFTEIGSNRFRNLVLALSKDERYLVNGSDSSFVQVFDLQQNSKKGLKIKGHTALVTDVKFLPDNSGFISSSLDRTIRFNDPISGKSRKLVTLPFYLKSIDINAAGNLVAGASASGQLVIVNLKDNTFTTPVDEAPNRILSVAFHPTRQFLAYGTESDRMISGERKTTGMVKIYDLVFNKVTKELSGHKAGIVDLEFSHDGLLLASAGLDQKLQMWVVDKEEDLPILMDNNNGYVWDIGFAKGSDYLIASCNSGEIRIWPTDPKLLAEQVCPELKRNMTEDEWEKYIGNKVPYETTCKSLQVSDF